MDLKQILLMLLPFAVSEFDSAAIPAIKAELAVLIKDPVLLALADDVLAAVQKAADGYAASLKP